MNLLDHRAHGSSTTSQKNQDHNKALQTSCFSYGSWFYNKKETKVKNGLCGGVQTKTIAEHKEHKCLSHVRQDFWVNTPWTDKKRSIEVHLKLCFRKASVKQGGGSVMVWMTCHMWWKQDFCSLSQNPEGEVPSGPHGFCSRTMIWSSAQLKVEQPGSLSSVGLERLQSAFCICLCKTRENKQKHEGSVNRWRVFQSWINVQRLIQSKCFSAAVASVLKWVQKTKTNQPSVLAPEPPPPPFIRPHTLTRPSSQSSDRRRTENCNRFKLKWLMRPNQSANSKSNWRTRRPRGHEADGRKTGQFAFPCQVNTSQKWERQQETVDSPLPSPRRASMKGRGGEATGGKEGRVFALVHGWFLSCGLAPHHSDVFKTKNSDPFIFSLLKLAHEHRLLRLLWFSLLKLHEVVQSGTCYFDYFFKPSSSVKHHLFYSSLLIHLLFIYTLTLSVICPITHPPPHPGVRLSFYFNFVEAQWRKWTPPPQNQKLLVMSPVRATRSSS